MIHEFEGLKGRHITNYARGHYSYDNNDAFYIEVDGVDVYRMTHHQDCCESVTLSDISGDMDDLLNEEILLAKESYRDDSNDDGTLMYTFYRLQSMHGDVTLLWDGSSNGYYGVDVSFDQVQDLDEIKAITWAKVCQEVKSNRLFLYDEV
jgi:hypothetical protein